MFDVSAEEMLAHWKNLAEDNSPEPWTEDHLGMFFQNFRPLGQGVEAAFTHVHQGEKILPRLLEVYQGTADGWGENDVYDWYFLVRQPKPMSREKAKDLLEQHLKNLQLLNGFIDTSSDQDVRNTLGSITGFEFVSNAPSQPDQSEANSVLYDFQCDAMSILRHDRQPLESHAHLLDEAFYTIAADYTLMYHLTWPLYAHLVEVTEPFQPYFELWKHGVKWQFSDAGSIKIFVPNPEA